MIQSRNSQDLVVVFRADASILIGSGHVMRCLTVADALAERGAVCHFLCRAHPGNMLQVISDRGHHVHALPESSQVQKTDDPNAPKHASWLGVGWYQDARQSREIIDDIGPDWLIIDHYALDARWECIATPKTSRLLVIDDLADRTHVADVLLDQNLGREANDYAGLVPKHCQVLAGPRYALLRPEFIKWRDSSLARRYSPMLKHILVTMGGVDKDNVSGHVLRMLKHCALPPNCRISVIMGSSAPWLASVQTLAASMPWPTEVASSVLNMAERMAQADLAIGAAGSTAWERCCLGLPTLMVVLADNQINIAESLHTVGAAKTLGFPEELAALPSSWAELTSTAALQAMAKSATAIVDGNGVLRLCHVLMNETIWLTER